MSASLPSPTRPESDSFVSVQSPYFEQVISVFALDRSLVLHGLSLKISEEMIQTLVNVLSEDEETQQKLSKERVERMQSVSEAQQNRLAVVARQKNLSQTLSSLEVRVAGYKLDAARDGVDVDRAVVNAPVLSGLGTVLTQEESNIGRKRAISYGVLIVAHTYFCTLLEGGISLFQEMLSLIEQSLKLKQECLLSLEDSAKMNLTIINSRQHSLHEYQTARDGTRSLIYREEERLSRSVVDLVLEWKRNSLKD